MDILIVSGFLGAGKTTFIRALSQYTGREIAILENEYAGAGIDGEMLRKDTAGGELNIWEMTEGCICCSMKGDFAASVLTIANAVDPQILVIEPTGVGYLSRILENLKQIEYEKIRLLAPVAIVDGHSYDRYSSEYSGLYADQITSARTVFVSKMESAEPEALERLGAALAQMNPTARIVTEHYTKMPLEDWNRLLETGLDGTSLQKAAPQEQELPESFAFDGAEMRSPEALIVLLEDIVHGAYGDIIRAKGVVRAGGQLFRFDVADGRYSMAGAEDGTANQAVFIGSALRRQALRRNFFERYAPKGARKEPRFAGMELFKKDAKA